MFYNHCNLSVQSTAIGNTITYKTELLTYVTWVMTLKYFLTGVRNVINGSEIMTKKPQHTYVACVVVLMTGHSFPLPNQIK